MRSDRALLELMGLTTPPPPEPPPRWGFLVVACACMVIAVLMVYAVGWHLAWWGPPWNG